MRLLQSIVHLNGYMEGKERRRKKTRKSYKANCIQQRLLETTQRPTSAPWSIEEGRKAGRKRRESNDTGTIAEEWMNEWNLFNCGWQLARNGHKDFYMCPREERYYSEIFRTFLFQVLLIFLVWFLGLSHPPSPPSPLTAQLILKWFSRNGLMHTSSAE